MPDIRRSGRAACPRLPREKFESTKNTLPTGRVSACRAHLLRFLSISQHFQHFLTTGRQLVAGAQTLGQT